MVSEGFCVGRLQRFAEDRAGRLLLLVLGGALTGLTLIYNSIGLLEWLTLIPAAYVLVGLAIRQDTKLRYTYGYGFAFFMSFYLVIYHWFNYLYPLEFTGGRGAGRLGGIVDFSVAFGRADLCFLCAARQNRDGEKTQGDDALSCGLPVGGL